MRQMQLSRLGRYKCWVRTRLPLKQKNSRNHKGSRRRTLGVSWMIQGDVDGTRAGWSWFVEGIMMLEVGVIAYTRWAPRQARTKLAVWSNAIGGSQNKQPSIKCLNPIRKPRRRPWFILRKTRQLNIITSIKSWFVLVATDANVHSLENA